MKSIRNVDVLYTIHEKSRVLEECICRVESACDTGHFESVDSALRTKPELRAALGTYIRQMLALLRMLTPQDTARPVWTSGIFRICYRRCSGNRTECPRSGRTCVMHAGRCTA